MPIRNVFEHVLEIARTIENLEVEDVKRELAENDAGGGRSVYAVKALQDMGYTNVAHLATGFGGWLAAGETIHNYAETSRWVRREPG